MNDIKCPHDLNQFLLGEPAFKNTFSEEECEQRKFYGDCYHCFSTAIVKRDQQLKNTINKIRSKIEGYKSTIDRAISEDEFKIEGMKEAYTDCLKIIDECTSEGSERMAKELVHPTQELITITSSFDDIIVKKKVFTEDEVIAILEEIYKEIEELEPPKSYQNEYTNAYLGAIAMKEKDKCIVQSKINALKGDK